MTWLAKLLFLLTLTVASVQVIADEDPLWPISRGASWTYEITNTGFSTVCAPGVSTTTIDEVREADGFLEFDTTHACGWGGTMKLEDGVYYSTYQNEWYVAVDRPEDGKISPGFRALIRYDLIPEITVPAGTFQNCYKLTYLVVYTQTWTYCPGVGEVHTQQVDMSGTGYELKLVDWSGRPVP